MRRVYPDISYRDVIWRGYVKYYRNPAGKPFKNKDIFTFEAKWRDFNKLESAFVAATEKEREAAASTSFAWDSDFGYLSPDPFHIGTGLEIGALVHLEGINLIGDMVPVVNALNAVRCFPQGLKCEGLNDIGHLYSVTNDASLGISERMLFDKVRNILQELALRECWARKRLVEEHPRLLEDAVSRALAIMKNCRMLSKWEFVDLLSPVRIVTAMGFVNGITVSEIDDYMIGQFYDNENEPAPMTVEEEDVRDRRDEAFAVYVNHRMAFVDWNGRGRKELGIS